MLNYYFKDSIESFLQKNTSEIIGSITLSNQFDSTLLQNKAWREQINILKEAVTGYTGTIFFEFSIPRMGKRVDAIVIISGIVFVIEFKVGESQYLSSQLDQVWDYALDLKNFHKPSHKAVLVPILIATEAPTSYIQILKTSHDDNLIRPIRANKYDLPLTIKVALDFFKSDEHVNGEIYEKGSYAPTPTIIEAAVSLYNGHNVSEITKSGGEARNLTETSAAIEQIIHRSKQNGEKSICFVTGVPGAGKTLVGLNIATKHLDKNNDLASVFLSGNGPLVAILREALTRDKYQREKSGGKKVRKGEILSEVKLFIQNVHNFRDDVLVNEEPPFEHIAIFDEAQRAWNVKQTESFMTRKKGRAGFRISEPEFLISVLDRHKDWAVMICLVGGGQEINTGEAGISEWIDALNRSFPEWRVYISDKLNDTEYAAGNALEKLKSHKYVFTNPALHLSVSIRSFRAEHLSLLVKNILDLKKGEAIANYNEIKHKYPIVLSRSVQAAKKWLREQARGTERYGMIVSSQAIRLKPLAIDVKSPMDPVHWFLGQKEDIRSSYYLEDVATEFQVQGLELDWVCVTWDGDFRHSNQGWRSYSFVGNQWQNINKEERKLFLKNAYRVLLTRARQGMIIVVPEGDTQDATRVPSFYDATYNYLSEIGFERI
jgi:hypothetical protein